MNSSQRAIVLFAHGSRDPLWPAPIQAVARQILINQPESIVRCAYLELTSPDLGTVCEALAAEGVNHVTVVPMFLGIGKHAREDLPQLVATLQSRFASLQLELRPPVGEDARLTQTLAHIACSPALSSPNSA